MMDYGAIERGDALRVTGLPVRTASRALKSAIDLGILASDTPKGPVSLRFTAATAEVLFPRLFG